MDVSREQLIDAIIEEIERIFGDEGFNGNVEEYDWLLEHYGVTEYEDVCWLFIVDPVLVKHSQMKNPMTLNS